MFLQWIKYIVAGATILTGLISLFLPNSVQGFTGLQANGGRGITEIRTILGALFIGLGIAVLYYNHTVGYQILGITYLTMGLVRIVSIIIDKSVVSSNIISAVVEVAFGFLLIL